MYIQKKPFLTDKKNGTLYQTNVIVDHFTVRNCKLLQVINAHVTKGFVLSSPQYHTHWAHFRNCSRD